ncbi:MAG: hypothetical protein AAFY28_04850 [Actinomycetota bacterium]
MVTMWHTDISPVAGRVRGARTVAPLSGSWQFACAAPTMGNSTLFGNGNPRTASTFEYCGTGGYMTTDSIQVVTNKPHLHPGTSPGVLT